MLELGTDVRELIGLVEVLLLELGADIRELIDRLDVVLLGARLVMTLLEGLILGAILVMTLLEGLLGALLVIILLELLLLGALLVIVLLEVLLLGARLVMALLELLMLGARLDMLLLGALLVIVLLEVLLLGVLLIVGRLELRLDETLLGRLDDDPLDEALGAGAGLETCRLELLDLVMLDTILAAITGSQNNKSANRVQKTRKSEPFRRDPTALSLEFWVLSFFEYIIRLLSSALTI